MIAEVVESFDVSNYIYIEKKLNFTLTLAKNISYLVKKIALLLNKQKMLLKFHWHVTKKGNLKGKENLWLLMAFGEVWQQIEF